MSLSLQRGLYGVYRGCIGSFRLGHHLIRSKSTISEKYLSKVENLAKKEGLTMEELVKSRQQKPVCNPFGFVKTSDSKSKPKEPLSQPNSSPSPNLGASASARASSHSLASYMDVEKLKLHDTKEIEMLWEARFLGKDKEVCGSITDESFAKLYVNARRYPTFVLPVPHKEAGAELHYLQWLFTDKTSIHCLITSLAEYKLHAEYAQPHTTIMFHTDFLVDKRMVLTNSLVQGNSTPLSTAVFLTLNLQRFYTATEDDPVSAAKLSLLRKFNSGSEKFDVEELMNSCETLG